jgi:hypothetical protein
MNQLNCGEPAAEFTTVTRDTLATKSRDGHALKGLGRIICRTVTEG